MARLLILDDDPETLAWMVPALEFRGHEVRAFTVASDALEELQQWVPDLIVSDIVMPEMNGIEFARLTRRFGGVPLMFVSVARQESEAVLVGALGYVHKPATAEELRSEVERVLGRKGERNTILLVDDDSDVRWLYHSLLDEYFEIIDAEHGAQALELLATRRVDLAIIDAHMPVMGGAELIRRVRSIPGLERLPIIVQTADRGVLTAPIWRDLHVSHVMEKDEFLDWMARRLDAQVGQPSSSVP